MIRLLLKLYDVKRDNQYLKNYFSVKRNYICLKWKLPRVAQHVNLQSGFSPKHLSTFLAREVLLTEVYYVVVCFHCSLCAIGFTTSNTDEVFDTSQSFLLLPQLPSPLLLLQLLLLRLRQSPIVYFVSQHVCLQVFCLAETFTTVLTPTQISWF